MFLDYANLPHVYMLLLNTGISHKASMEAQNVAC